ncbi:diguanylate cyclase with PAS/PAC sensor [Azoarcus sp. KH32C]|nr:diguanylate cyclase with PAS/PAC sensor [Azoarcus sp. KH32C]
MNHNMRIRYKITLAVGIAVTIVLVAMAFFYTHYQEKSVLRQNERTMEKLTESVAQGLQAVMLAGSADIAESYADRLKKVSDVLDFRILRTNGDEAFRDNKTILAVNKRRGEETFAPRETEMRIPVLPADDPNLLQTVETAKTLPIYERGEDGHRILTFLAPIRFIDSCSKCHGKGEKVRGVIKLTTSLASVERDIYEVRQYAIGALALALAATMMLTGYMLGRTVVEPLEKVTNAMARVSGGDLDHQVPIQTRDELGRMASSFNHMTSELKTTYDGLRREQDKLTTIIHGAGEGIVVTDNHGDIVLVNPAAERLLEKPASQIVEEGFIHILDNPDEMRTWLGEDATHAAVTTEYKGRILQVFASTILGSENNVVGSAALLRDITEEKRLEEELRRLSTTDGLTGLYNRRHLDATLATEYVRSTRTGASLAVVMFDIDHFKKFNDTYGHDQGDRVLQAVARNFRDALRKYDLACRYGGEEFVGILPNTTLDGAFSVAERLRCDIEAAEVDGLKVTISLGVAAFPEISVAGPEGLIEAADAALYGSKEAGRNRTTRAEPLAGSAAAEPAADAAALPPQST